MTTRSTGWFDLMGGQPLHQHDFYLWYRVPEGPPLLRTQTLSGVWPPILGSPLNLSFDRKHTENISYSIGNTPSNQKPFKKCTVMLPGSQPCAKQRDSQKALTLHFISVNEKTVPNGTYACFRALPEEEIHGQDQYKFIS